jgi:hypothetical protein
MQPSTSAPRESPPVLSRSTTQFLRTLIERHCLRDDLSTYDPYDIWKTPAGLAVKKLYNARPRAGLIPAAAFALFDDVINNRTRWFYERMEYPIVRAMASLSLINLFERYGNREYREYAVRHLNWLIANSSPGYSGLCWGLGFPNAVTREIVYASGTPYTTMTPYPLEALVRFSEATRDDSFYPAIGSVRRFFDRDVVTMEEDATSMAVSYGPYRDRTVTNATSYCMYSYALLLNHAPMEDRAGMLKKIHKLYEFVRRHQRRDGSWLYSPYGSSFVDCFHSCIVLKNLLKTGRQVALDGIGQTIEHGYAYVKRALFDQKNLLFRRFSVANKRSLVRFDLYDNAEALNLAVLIGDHALARELTESIVRHFADGDEVYSQIDVFGRRRGKNTLRWAVMPFLYATSELI